jgi:hypothetical protein
MGRGEMQREFPTGVGRHGGAFSLRCRAGGWPDFGFKNLQFLMGS